MRSVILSEWNMNVPGNIKTIGNYRYRPNEPASLYKNIPNTFDQEDNGNYYNDATLSYEQIQNTYNIDDTLQIFKSQDQKRSLYYSLEDCLKPFRPRSGINKTTYFNNKYLPTNTVFGNNSPRYYMSSRYDDFKYWTSYRKEEGKERGIAKAIVISGDSDLLFSSGPRYVAIPVREGKTFSFIVRSTLYLLIFLFSFMTKLILKKLLI